MKLLNECSKGTNVAITWIANKLKNIHPEFNKSNTLTVINTDNADMIIRMNKKNICSKQTCCKFDRRKSYLNQRIMQIAM